MIHYKNNLGWLIIATLFAVFIPSTIFSQMYLTLHLPNENSGIIIIKNYTLDSSDTIYFKVFTGQKIQTIIQLPDSILNSHPVLNYQIRYENGALVESYCFGATDTIDIDLSTQEIKLSKNHPLSKFTDLSNKYNGSAEMKSKIIEELKFLYINNIYSNYTHFILFSAFNNGLITKAEIIDNFQIDKNNSYWVTQLKNTFIERDSSINVFQEKLEEFSSQHNYILLKFWATWCAPCLKDDIKLKELKMNGNFEPFIVGIQADDKQKNELFYFNLIDKSKSIASHFNIQGYPHYILMKNGIEVYRTTDIDKIISELLSIPKK